MDEAVITVEARVVGQRKPLITGRQVSLAVPPSGGSSEGAELRLRDVLTQVVRQEVAAFTQRQEGQRLTRVLSPDDVEQAAATGKIAMGGVEHPAGTPVNPDGAVAAALQAFADGLYFVFLDGQQQENLDAVVALRPTSTLTFIRLVALAGG